MKPSRVKKILVVTDSFYPKGGNTLAVSDLELTSRLKEDKSIDMSYVSSSGLKRSDIEESNHILLTNFLFLGPDLIDTLIQHRNFSIFDFNYVSKGSSFSEKYSELYRSAKKIFAFSELHKRLIIDRVGSLYVENLSTAFWSKEQLHFIKKYEPLDKTGKVTIFKNQLSFSGDSLENFKGLLRVQKRRYDLILESTWMKNINNISRNRTLAFFPTQIMIFGKIICEARMLGLDVLTDVDLVGFLQEEEYKEVSGAELIGLIEEKIVSSYEKIKKEF